MLAVKTTQGTYKRAFWVSGGVKASYGDFFSMTLQNYCYPKKLDEIPAGKKKGQLDLSNR